MSLLILLLEIDNNNRLLDCLFDFILVIQL